MKEWDFPGAKWWKFDFHTHTPASQDFTRDTGKVTPESWLKAFMEEKIDCVAVTDHNSGGWIDTLKQELARLEENQPIWYHPLYLFPGVEISVSGGVHLLAIFGHDVNQSGIDRLLGAVDYQGTKGESNGVTSKSVIEVVDEIVKQGGIAIPAHADKKRGVLFQLQGETLRQILKNGNIYAMELCDSNYRKPPLYTDEKVKWTEVRGSDTHGFIGNAPGTFGTFTWIKMDTPSIDGLELALQDGDDSVICDMTINPNNQREKYLIEEIEIHKAKYIGRSQPLNCQFSPWLNTIIGGRGSGKSTLLEFMRLALRREAEIPESLKAESRKYFSPAEGDLLIEDSRISLIYCKGEVRYRLNWSPKADCPSLEEEKDGNWVACPGDIKTQFPVRIYSQKQIFELAKEPSAMIYIIDEASEVDAGRLKTRNKDLINQYKQIEAKQGELNEKIAEEDRLCGEANDLVRQIEQIEKSGHKVVLQNYRARQQQLNEFANLEDKWEDMSRQLTQMQSDIAPADFNAQHFIGHADVWAVLEKRNKNWQSIRDRLSTLAQEAEAILIDWHAEKNSADWMQALKTDITQYEQLRSELERQGINPDRYPLLLTQQKEIEKELTLIGEYRSRQQKLEAKKRAVFKQIEENRKTLTQNRQEFLTMVLQNNQFVSIKVNQFGEDWDRIEQEIRRILHCGDRFDNDFERLKEDYRSNGGKNFAKLKERVKRIRGGVEDTKNVWFTRHLETLPQESIIDLMLWFPEDDLKFTLGSDGRGIKKASPGEKNAALLAFILSYGDEPLLLDQPEDDLDNKLIYNLIVHQLRKTKSKRQIIVVTHNANIVVNGNAEMVFPLGAADGETRIQHAANIQEKEIQAAICDILEGGREAFDKRYKRIHLKS